MSYSPSKSISDTQYKYLLSYLDNSTPTRNQSVNDCPNAESYYKIIISEQEDTCTYFVYQVDAQTYVEMPYVGIYKSDAILINDIEVLLGVAPNFIKT